VIGIYIAVQGSKSNKKHILGALCASAQVAHMPRDREGPE